MSGLYKHTQKTTHHQSWQNLSGLAAATLDFLAVNSVENKNEKKKKPPSAQTRISTGSLSLSDTQL